LRTTLTLLLAGIAPQHIAARLRRRRRFGQGLLLLVKLELLLLKLHRCGAHLRLMVLPRNNALAKACQSSADVETHAWLLQAKQGH
jgi:hypothetical protein